MPSIQESRLHVQDKLQRHNNADVDHDAILATLQDEIDRHNAVKSEFRGSMSGAESGDVDERSGSLEKTRCSTEASAIRKRRTHFSEIGGDETSSRRRHDRPSSSIRKFGHLNGEDDSEPSMKFRFKAGKHDPRRRKRHRSDKHDDGTTSAQRRRRRENELKPDQESSDAASAHPFPRESLDPLATETDPNAAFRTSLFDALADDEGAAYWESVYSQPIHVYPRPTVQTTQGTLEAMSDDEYVNYVKTKMWERKHPEIMQERQRKDKERKQEEENRTRRREEFVRRREQAAWERAQRWKGHDEGDEDDEPHARKRHTYEFTGDTNRAPSDLEQEEQEYSKAWIQYSSAWDKLKWDLLSERNDPDHRSDVQPSKRIPWPVLASKPVVKANIEAFMRRAPSDAEKSKVQLLKAERVRWHPDKVQQRFGGAVDEGTMKIVTGVFQVVDGLLEQTRKEAGEV